MRIEIDFDNKVISLKDKTNLGELVKKFKELNFNWKEFKIDTTKCEYCYYPTPYVCCTPYVPTAPYMAPFYSIQRIDVHYL